MRSLFGIARRALDAAFTAAGGVHGVALGAVGGALVPAFALTALALPPGMTNRVTKALLGGPPAVVGPVPGSVPAKEPPGGNGDTEAPWSPMLLIGRRPEEELLVAELVIEPGAVPAFDAPAATLVLPPATGTPTPLPDHIVDSALPQAVASAAPADSATEQQRDDAERPSPAESVAPGPTTEQAPLPGISEGAPSAQETGASEPAPNAEVRGGIAGTDNAADGGSKADDNRNEGAEGDRVEGTGDDGDHGEDEEDGHRAQHPERPERPEHPDQSERPEHPAQSERPDPPDQPDQPERP